MALSRTPTGCCPRGSLEASLAPQGLGARDSGLGSGLPLRKVRGRCGRGGTAGPHWGWYMLSPCGSAGSPGGNPLCAHRKGDWLLPVCLGLRHQHQKSASREGSRFHPRWVGWWSSCIRAPHSCGGRGPFALSAAPGKRIQCCAHPALNVAVLWPKPGVGQGGGDPAAPARFGGRAVGPRRPHCPLWSSTKGSGARVAVAFLS